MPGCLAGRRNEPTQHGSPRLSAIPDGRARAQTAPILTIPSSLRAASDPRADAVRGPPAPPLVVVEEAEGVLQAIEVGQQVAVVEVGAAVEHDEGLALPDRPRVGSNR
jgi:hypothetical protein